MPVRDYARARRTRRTTSPWVKAVLATILVVFVAGGLYSGYVFYSTLKAAVMQPPSWSLPSIPDGASVTSQQPADPGVTIIGDASSPVWTGQERVNVLLLGVDQRQDEKGQPTRSDTMIVLTLDPVSKTGGMLSIPRDLWVAIPLKEVGEERINSANFFGDVYKYPGGGPALAKKTVSLNLGIPIHYYARVDFQGFERVVDSIGGINVDVQTPLRDDQYPDGNYGTIRIFIPAGLQHMDGQTALIYARSRHSDSDFGRIKRQQQVLMALREQGLQLGLLPKLPFLFTTLKDSVATDVPAKEALVLAQLAAQIDVKNITSRSIDPNMVTEYITPGGADVVVPKREEIKQLIQEMFYPPKAPTPTAVPPTPTASAVEDKQKLKADAATIEVQNGAGIDGLAARAKSALELRGYQVVGIADAELTNYKDTVLIYYSDTKKYTRDQLVRFFNVSPANVRNGNNPRSSVDFRVILGSSAKIP